MVENSEIEHVVLHGDCLEKMKLIPDNGIDSIITDPPYGLSFMGKKWDYDVPAVEVWVEALRVLKPGGTLLCFAGSRTQHRMAVNVEDAGFILKDCIMWLYGSGFPKATDISKQLDKGHDRKQGKLRTDGRGASPQKLDNHGQGDTGIGHADGSKQQYHETLPATPEAILWNGWKSHGLKPAYEPILVAMKPNEGTYANNALVHGVSGLNIDGGRIEGQPHHNYGRTCSGGIYTGKTKEPINTPPQGRFPANVILDEETGRMLDEQSGVSTSTASKNRNGSNAESLMKKGFEGKNVSIDGGHNDSGGASRFFYCAKASKKERNAGCEGLEEKRGSDDYRPGDDGSSGIQSRLHGATKKGTNHHPTVKPLALMEYLCTLTKTPTGGLVLDPYAGSGTTGVACIKTGRDCVLIEKEPTYWPIIDKRIADAHKNHED